VIFFFFPNRVSGTICLGLALNHNPLHLCLSVARITGMSHCAQQFCCS
jgi:hypothetical protein